MLCSALSWLHLLTCSWSAAARPRRARVARRLGTRVISEMFMLVMRLRDLCRGGGQGVIKGKPE